MRSLLVTVAAAFTLSIGVLAQTELPKRMHDARPPSMEFKDASVSDVLRFLAVSADIDIRYDLGAGLAAGGTRQSLNLSFRNTSVAEVFAVVMRASGLRYTVIDESAVLVTAP